MRKKHIPVFLILFLLVLILFACKPKESDEGKKEESTESCESRTQEDWAGPEIFRFRLRNSAELRQEDKVNQAIHQLGELFLKSRSGSVEQAQHGLEPYGYCIERYWNFKPLKVFNTASRDMLADEELKDIKVQQEGNTWVAGYFACVSKWGSLPSSGGPRLSHADTQYWNLGDWWIIHQNGDIFSMMSYTDYLKVRQVHPEYAEDPFEAYPVEEDDILESEYREDYPRYDINFIKEYFWADEVLYSELLKAYIKKGTLIFEYEFDSEESSADITEKAALELGRLYLEELCSREYDMWPREPIADLQEHYYVKDYKELQLQRLENSLNLTEEKMAEHAEYPDIIHNRYSHVPSDCFIPGNPSSLFLKAGENIWVADYGALVKSDDPTWGITMTETGKYAVGEEFKPNADAALRMIDFIIFKEGSKYFMVPAENIVMGSAVRKE